MCYCRGFKHFLSPTMHKRCIHICVHAFNLVCYVIILCGCHKSSIN